MRTYICQTDIIWEDKQANYDNVADLLESAGIHPGSLIVLPELFATGFSMDVPSITESSDLPTLKFLKSLAAQYQSWILGGFATTSQKGLGLNQASLISPDQSESIRYTKNYPFSLAGESSVFQAGEEVHVHNCDGINICPTICYDLRFPELFRKGVASGADVFAVIANWPIKRVDHWITLLQARAIENQAWVIGVNRCGKDPNHTYPGRSLIVDPHGIIRTQLHDSQDIASSTISPSLTTNWRSSFPALKDIKP